MKRTAKDEIPYSPVVLHVDIETSYTIGAVWGMWEQNVAQVLQDWQVLGVGWQYDHEEKPHWKGLPDFPGYKKGKLDDKALMKFTYDLLNTADVVVAHNGRQFDMKKLRFRFLMHGFPPLNEPLIFDTKVEMKKKFAADSNKLDELSRQLFGERKVKHPGIEMWTGCMAGDPKMWKQMGVYCLQDVVLLKKLYHVIRPHSTAGANYNLWGDRPLCCPQCGFAGIYKHGFRFNAKTVQQKFRCSRKSCGHIFAGPSIKRVTYEKYR